MALAPFLPSSEATFSASPFSTACRSRSSFLFHSLVCGAKGRHRVSGHRQWPHSRIDRPVLSPPSSPPFPQIKIFPKMGTLKIPSPSPWRHSRRLVSQKETSTVQWNSGRSPNLEIVTSFIWSWEDEATYLKDLEASLHISLFLAKLDSWPLRTVAFDLVHSSLGPQCYKTKQANSSRLPESLYTHHSLSAFIATLSGLLTGPWFLSCILILSSCPGYRHNTGAPETKLLPEQANIHQTALSRASTNAKPQPQQSSYANHSNSKAFMCTKISF